MPASKNQLNVAPPSVYKPHTTHNSSIRSKVVHWKPEPEPAISMLYAKHECLSLLSSLHCNEGLTLETSYENEFCVQFHFHANQSHFHNNGFALRLALKKRHRGTRKWPIQTSLNLCDRSQRQNSVAATMISTCHTRRFVAATCRGDVSQRFVASCVSAFKLQ